MNEGDVRCELRWGKGELGGRGSEERGCVFM